LKKILHIKSCLVLGLVLSMLVLSPELRAATKTWLGGSTNWNTAGNWSASGVPLAGDNVVIQSGSANYPILTAAATNSVNNITISSGGSLTIQTGGSLTSTGNLTMNGTLSITGGAFVTVDVTGSGNISISIGTLAVRDFDPTGGTTSMSSGLFQVSHDWTPNPPSIFVPTGGTVQFTGNAGGAAFNVNTGVYTFYNVQVDATHPGFKANITINNILRLNAQIVLPSAINMTATGLILGGVGQAGGTWGSTTSTATYKNNTYFSGTGIITVSTNLFIALINFNGYEEIGKTQLRWSTATEIKHKKFIIERSIDKNMYLFIGEVQGSGTNSTQKDYTFTDKNPLPGFNYYRLKQEDFDGKMEYSKTISVKIEWKERGISIFPNPATTTVTFSLVSDYEGPADLIFYDLLGRPIKTQSLQLDGLFQTRVDLSSLPPGMYTMIVKVGLDTWQERLLVN